MVAVDVAAVAEAVVVATAVAATAAVTVRAHSPALGRIAVTDSLSRLADQAAEDTAVADGGKPTQPSSIVWLAFPLVLVVDRGFRPEEEGLKTYDLEGAVHALPFSFSYVMCVLVPPARVIDLSPACALAWPFAFDSLCVFARIANRTL